MLQKLGLKGSDAKLDATCAELGTHPLTLSLVGRLVAEFFDGDYDRFRELPFRGKGGFAVGGPEAQHLQQVFQWYEQNLGKTEKIILQTFSLLQRPINLPRLAGLFRAKLEKNILIISFAVVASLIWPFLVLPDPLNWVRWTTWAISAILFSIAFWLLIPMIGFGTGEQTERLLSKIGFPHLGVAFRLFGHRPTAWEALTDPLVFRRELFSKDTVGYRS